MGLLSGLLGNASVMDNKQVEKEFEKIFVKGEKVEAGFKIIRDLFIFTNKRLVLIDKQGLTGRKKLSTYRLHIKVLQNLVWKQLVHLI